MKKHKLLAALLLCLALLALAGAGVAYCAANGEQAPAGSPVRSLWLKLEGPPKTAPEDTVRLFFDSILAGTAETANTALESGSIVLPQAGGKAAELLRSSYAYRLDEPFDVEPQEGRSATGHVSFTYFDLSALAGLAEEPLRTALEQQVQSHPKRESYDENLNYLPAVLESAVDGVYEALLADISPYLKTVELELSAVYREGAWRLTVPETLNEALWGGLPESPGTEPGAAADAYLEQLKAESAATAPYIRKTYRLEEDCVLAPTPIASAYGTTTDPAVIRQLVEAAAELLEGQGTVWNEDVQLLEGTAYRYYRDDTILVITWKEMLEGEICTCAEVRIADPTQLMRKLMNDSYGEVGTRYCSELAESVNAVFASNADFYLFRSVGTVVYEGKVYRCDPYMDVCYFDRAGDMHMVHAGELASLEETEAYVAENDIRFSLAFGPIIIENGVNVCPRSYIVGQIEDNYSRAAIGMTGKLHYFFMTANFDAFIWTLPPPLTVLADFMVEKGIPMAYGLDGGKTSELYMDGTVLNRVDWGTERAVSDILAFGTAIPENER